MHKKWQICRGRTRFQAVNQKIFGAADKLGFMHDSVGDALLTAQTNDRGMISRLKTVEGHEHTSGLNFQSKLPSADLLAVFSQTMMSRQ